MFSVVQHTSETFHFLFFFFIIFFIYSWLELLHFVIIVSTYIMMVNSVLHWKWKANWRQLFITDSILYFFVFACGMDRLCPFLRELRVIMFEMLCVIWYRLYNFNNMKNTHGGMLLLLKLQALAFLAFFNSHKWYQIAQCITFKDLLTFVTRKSNCLWVIFNLLSVNKRLS